MTTTLTPEQFWQRVDISPEKYSCWLYRADAPGFRNATGHIRISIGGGLPKTYAHIFAYASVFGPASGKLTCHFCDTPACMAPWHLALGDAARNCAERDHRGRRTPFLPRSPLHPSSKLTQTEADELREARLAGVNVQLLAAEYSVSVTSIRNIWRGATYCSGLS
jgi:hypothetical protein